MFVGCLVALVASLGVGTARSFVDEAGWSEAPADGDDVGGLADNDSDDDDDQDEDVLAASTKVRLTCPSTTAHRRVTLTVALPRTCQASLFRPPRSTRL